MIDVDLGRAIYLLNLYGSILTLSSSKFKGYESYQVILGAKISHLCDLRKGGCRNIEDPLID